MIKVPATEAGYKAMEALTSEGIPVNATLIFKKSQALSCAKAFESGVKANGAKVDTVISIFVSRVDRALDVQLSKLNIEVAKSGIYNTADIYAAIEAMNVLGCRALFASTGVKDDSLPAHYYIEQLLAYNSVNTAPIDTIKAYVQNGAKEKVLPISQAIITEHFEKIKAADIDFEALLDKQIKDGLDAFKDAFQEIMEAL
jgi:transaldolase